MFVAVLDAQEWRSQTGPEWFEKQDDNVKREMLGPKAFEHYARGEVRLSDFAGERSDRHLGAVTYQRSLKEVLERRRRAA